MHGYLPIMVLASTVLAAACSARRGEPLYGPLPISSAEVANGQKVFMRECHQCHPGGEAGLGPAINNKPLPGFLMAFQVRRGFGAMPAFSEGEISSQELDDLIQFLKEIRNHRGRS
jgi:mono/diheme cytochrome c family protein